MTRISGQAPLLGSTAIAGQPIEIWYQDEARVGQKGTHAVLVLDGAGWRFLIDDPDRIISIGTRQWATVSGYEGWY